MKFLLDINPRDCVSLTPKQGSHLLSLLHNQCNTQALPWNVGWDERETCKKGDGSQKLPVLKQGKKKVGNWRREGQCPPSTVMSREKGPVGDRNKLHPCLILFLKWYPFRHTNQEKGPFFADQIEMSPSSHCMYFTGHKASTWPGVLARAKLHQHAAFCGEASG